jgi:hypothetical protein
MLLTIYAFPVSTTEPDSQPGEVDPDTVEHPDTTPEEPAESEGGEAS